jgi:hypothetical protein
MQGREFEEEDERISRERRETWGRRLFPFDYKTNAYYMSRVLLVWDLGWGLAFQCHLQHCSSDSWYVGLLGLDAPIGCEQRSVTCTAGCAGSIAFGVGRCSVPIVLVDAVWARGIDA